MEVDRQEICKEMVKNGFGYFVVLEICFQFFDELYILVFFYKNNEFVICDMWFMYDFLVLELFVVKVFIIFLNEEKV